MGISRVRFLCPQKETFREKCNLHIAIFPRFSCRKAINDVYLQNRKNKHIKVLIVNKKLTYE